MNINKKIFFLAVFFMLLTMSVHSNSAHCGEADNYLMLRGGIAFPEDMDIDVSGGSGSTVSFNRGYGVSISYGRNITSWLRGELELGFSEVDADTIRMIKRDKEVDDNGKDQHLYGMVNLMADLHNSTPLTPSVGFGLGAARAKLENTFLWPGNNTTISRESSDTAFAYQFIAGVLWDISPAWGVELRGRYFVTNERLHENHAAGVNTDLEVDGSSILMFDFGVQYKF